MIPQSLVDEVVRLLAEGKLSQRKIAQRTGVSRGSVGAIAAGRRRDPPPKKCEDEFDLPTGPLRRCPECGAVVYLPCRGCRLRKILARRNFPRRPERALGPLEMELKDDHRSRYEQLHSQRMLVGEPDAEPG